MKPYTNFVYVNPSKRVHAIVRRPTPSFGEKQFFSRPFDFIPHESAVVGFVDKSRCLEEMRGEGCTCEELPLSELMYTSHTMLRMPVVVVVSNDSVFFSRAG